MASRMTTTTIREIYDTDTDTGTDIENDTQESGSESESESHENKENMDIQTIDESKRKIEVRLNTTADLTDSAARYLTQNNDDVNGLTKLLGEVVTPINMEEIVRSQNEQLGRNETGGPGGAVMAKVLLESCPKELIYVGIPCLTVICGFLVYTEQFLIVIVVLGLCFLAHYLTGHLDNAQSLSSNTEIKNLQLTTCEKLSNTNVETVKHLAAKSVEMQTIRTNGILQISQIEAGVRKDKMKAIQEMHLVDTEGKMKMKAMGEEGKTTRKKIMKEKSENVAKVKAESLKHKAELEKLTAISLKNIELQQTAVEEETKRLHTQIDSETKRFVAKTEGETNERTIRFEKKQKAAKRAHEQSFKSAELKSQQESNRIKLQKYSEVEIAKIEAEKENMRHETEREKIRETSKTEREKGGCMIV